MGANILLIICSMIFMICIVEGLVRGFVKIIASLAASILILIMVFMLTPYASKAIRKVTPLNAMVKRECVDVFTTYGENGKITIQDREYDIHDLMKSGISEDEIKKMLSDVSLTKEQQIASIKNAKLPGIFREMLLENNNPVMYQKLGAASFGEYIGNYLAKIIADFVAFLLTLLIVTIIVRTILYTLGIISDLPMVGGVNRLAGGALGMVTALMIVWVIMVLVTLLYTTGVGHVLMHNIEESRILTFLYDHNVLLKAVTKFK